MNKQILKWFKNVSIKRKLYFVVGIMALLIAIELFTLWFAVKTLSSVRAYVGGEGLWSKAQKDAGYYLQKYGHTHDERDYLRFREFLKTPLGDARARLELAKKDPDLNIARQGFIEGHNHPDDVDGMIWLFRTFNQISYIEKAIYIWGEAEPLMRELVPISERLHKKINSPNTSGQEINAILAEIDPINQKLTKLEDEFSYTLGEGSRWLENLILKILFLIAITVEFTGLFLTISVSITISRGIREVVTVSDKIAAGDFSSR
ncbi:MAG TPA: hybrid sensor histidine kinase/response regulator, partial [Bacteroidia bacterium]|nr:hybrid sensor histidine kinase/response regulator [Bacteroidia bacterium]